MALHPHNRTARPERIIEPRVPMDVSRYVTPNLIAQIAAHEGFYSKVTADTHGSQVGFGFNRGPKTREVASAVLDRVIVNGTIISHQDAIKLTEHKIGQKIKQFVEPHIGQGRFDKLSQNAQAAVLDTLYNLTDNAGAKFAIKIAEKIDLDQSAGIPALISSYATMKGTPYEKGLTKRRRDAAALAMLPDGATFKPSKPVYDYGTKKDLPADLVSSLIQRQNVVEPKSTVANTAPEKKVTADKLASNQPQSEAAPSLITRILTVLRPLYTYH